MKCTGCGQELGPPPAKCVPCGKSFVVKKKPPPPPDPDIKIVDEPAAVPPPRAVAPPRRYRPPLRSRGTQFTIGGVLGVVIVVGFIGFRACRAVSRISGKTVVDETVTIGADDAYTGSIEVEGRHSYTFEVTAIDGEVRMGFGRVRDLNNPTEAELLAILSSGRAVSAGRSETMTGNMDTGSYVWAVVNASETRGSRVKIKFNGKER